MRYANDVNTMQVTKSLALSSELSGAVICVKGTNIGSMFPVCDGCKVLIGRDPKSCNYVVTNPNVSRKHLELTFDRKLMKYRVKDISRNGTYIVGGERLKKNQEYYLLPETELWLGEKSSIYKLL